MRKALIPLLILMLVAGAAQAAKQLEVIQLTNRSAAEIVPLIKPLVDQDVSLVADGFRLLVRGNPPQIEQVRTLVGRLDQAPLSLRLTLRTTRGGSADRSGGGVHGEVRDENGQIRGHGHVEIYSTENDDDRTSVQHVRVTAGYPAYVHNHLQIPIVQRSGFVGRHGAGYSERREYKKVPDGFYVLATAHGQNVTVRLAAEKAALTGAEDSPIETSGLTTTVTGPLNRWLSVGGVRQDESERRDGVTYSTEQRNSTDLQWELKAEEVDR